MVSQFPSSLSSLHLFIQFDFDFLRASLIAQLVKNPHAMQETRFDSWVRKIPKKGQATHSSILAWRISRTVQPMVHKELDMIEGLIFIFNYLQTQGNLARNTHKILVHNSHRFTNSHLLQHLLEYALISFTLIGNINFFSHVRVSYRNPFLSSLETSVYGASLVAQGLKIHLSVQETWVPSLVWENPKCPRATKLVCHDY